MKGNTKNNIHHVQSFRMRKFAMPEEFVFIKTIGRRENHLTLPAQTVLNAFSLGQGSWKRQRSIFTWHCCETWNWGWFQLRVFNGFNDLWELSYDQIVGEEEVISRNSTFQYLGFSCWRSGMGEGKSCPRTGSIRRRCISLRSKGKHQNPRDGLKPTSGSCFALIMKRTPKWFYLEPVEVQNGWLVDVFHFFKWAFSGSMLNFGGVLYTLVWNPFLSSSDHQDVRSHQEGLDMPDSLLSNYCLQPKRKNINNTLECLVSRASLGCNSHSLPFIWNINPPKHFDNLWDGASSKATISIFPGIWFPDANQSDNKR